MSKLSPGARAVHLAELKRDLTTAGAWLHLAPSMRSDALVLGSLEGVVDLYADLRHGRSVAARWSAKAHFRVDADFKDRTELADQLANATDAILVSARLREFLEAHVEGLEVLPVTLLPVRGKKPLGEGYVVVNVLAKKGPLINRDGVVLAANAFAHQVQAAGFSNVVFRDAP